MGRASVPGLSAVALCSFVLACSCAAGSVTGAQSEYVQVEFSFCPAKSGYAPGEDFSIEVQVLNVWSSGDYVYDSLAYMVKVTNVSAHFFWMAPNEWAWNNVSGSSSWLAPDGEGMETYWLHLTVPENLTAQAYCYYFKVEYLYHLYYANMTDEWGTGTTYRDFVVLAEDGSPGESEDDDGASIDYFPFFAAVALILSVGAFGAVLYYMRVKDLGGLGPGGARASSISYVPSGGNGYPAIMAVPGEHFPIEKGFIYMVKEQRPYVSFAMFNEATDQGAKGMVVSREHPNRLKEMHQFSAEKLIWLTRRAGTNHVDPTELSLVSLMITKFVEGAEKTVVLIEGIEYLITQNDFETVLRFVNHLHDFVLAHDCAVVVMLDPRVLSTRELALLERSMKIVEPYEQVPEPPPEDKEEPE